MNIRELKGIGDKTAQLYKKLGVESIEDLLHLYPRDYELFNEPILIKDIKEDDVGNVIAIDGVVSTSPDVFRKGKFTIVSCLVRDKEGNGIKCTWYNMPFISRVVRPGKRSIFRGRLNSKNVMYIIEQPKLYSVSEYVDIQGMLKPIYPLTKGLSNSSVEKAIKQSLKECLNEEEYLPQTITELYGLMSLKEAVSSVHFPKNREMLAEARKRLIFDEFFLFALSALIRKSQNKEPGKGIQISYDKRIDDVIKNLPYTLTDSQQNAMRDITKDMSSDKAMNRLLHGDVGSGKTIIALLSMINTAFSGYQSALMAPTEVLAIQEYEELIKLLERENIGIRAELLTGSTTASVKRKIYEGIESGEVDIVVGTHALIQDKVHFKSLGLAITDEQHRFGVNQRKRLKTHEFKDDKSLMSNVLVMSATPIPRTLAWILFADLDITLMKNMPIGRLPIKNAVVDTSYRNNAYRFIKDQVAEGYQAYIICPMIEEGEMEGVENVEDYSRTLKKELGSKIVVGELNGRMSNEEKNRIMEQFKNNEINVLVSTTVVEVGVNVPNATFIMVENAERFGLSQLHQLRGRVGRGDAQSYCLFVSDKKSKETKKRLEIISETNDGFKLAEEDLKLRGPGDFFGIRQSGEVQFNLADPTRDSLILKAAVDEAERILENDKKLEKTENVKLCNKLNSYMIYQVQNINL